MKVVHLTGAGLSRFRIAELPKPAPGKNEVLVNIKAVSLNYMDLLIAMGNYKKDISYPYVPGADGAGVIESVGSDVTQWQKGDRVVIQFVQSWLGGRIDKDSHTKRIAWELPGLMSEYVCISETGIVKAPSNLSHEETATLPVAALTAWQALIDQAGLKIGQTVLIQGTGGVSLAALQIAKAAGARVIATTGSDKKVKPLLALGASAVVNYRKDPNWSDAVRLLTNGEGVDITLDVGGNNSIAQSLLSLKENGFLSTSGFLSGANLHIDIHQHKINMSSLRIQGVAVGSVQSFVDLNRAIELNNIHPVVDEIFPAENVADAYTKLQRNEHFGKIVVNI